MKFKLTNDAVLSSSTARQFWFAGEQQFLKLNVNKNRLGKEQSGGNPVQSAYGETLFWVNSRDMSLSKSCFRIYNIDLQSGSFPQIICYVILYVTYNNSWVYHLKLKITACEII